MQGVGVASVSPLSRAALLRIDALAAVVPGIAGGGTAPGSISSTLPCGGGAVCEGFGLVSISHSLGRSRPISLHCRRSVSTTLHGVSSHRWASGGRETVGRCLPHLF